MGQRNGLRRRVLAVLAALGAMGSIAALAAVPSLASRSRDAKASFLYVLQAHEGWAAKQPNGHWRLTLLGVSALEFSDRPVRVAKAIRVASFVADFKHLFSGSPPNGAFVVQHAPRGQAPTAVEIFKAFWEKPGQLALCMCTIGSQRGAVSWLSQLTRATAAQHGEITLFIDSSGNPPIQYAGDRARRRSGAR
jgi:hypothetical protein